MSIPWGVFQWAVEHPELGWILLGAWLFFELHSKRGRIYALDKKITGAIIVVRALARKESAIDEDKVDEYLVENGMTPGDFFRVEEGEPAASKSLLGEEDNSPNKDERSTE